MENDEIEIEQKSRKKISVNKNEQKLNGFSFVHKNMKYYWNESLIKTSVVT